jgi:DNA-binding CsgD family transcriptional regulator
MAPAVDADGAIALHVPVASIPTTLWSLYALGCWVATLVLEVRRLRNTPLNRERRQGAILVRWQIITISFVLVEFYATSVIPGWTLPSQSPLLISIWVGAVVYAMWKYGFLRISPGLLAEGILDSIEDLVILYDTDGNRVYANRKAASLLGVPMSRPFAGPHGRSDPLAEGISTLLGRVADWRPDEPERRFRLNLAGNDADAQPLSLVVRAKPAFDRFNDPIGVAVTATVQPRLKDLLQAYELTDREAEVLEYLAAGLSIGGTARLLSITERTVKAHITSIYQKTGAVNRVELLNMVGGAEP